MGAYSEDNIALVEVLGQQTGPFYVLLGMAKLHSHLLPPLQVVGIIHLYKYG